MAHIAVVSPEAGMSNPEICGRILVAMLQELSQRQLTTTKLKVSITLSISIVELKCISYQQRPSRLTRVLRR